MSSFIPGVPSQIALLEGPMLLGYLFSYGLFGVLSLQLLLYHHNFPRDPKWMKCLVWGVAFTELVITVLQTIAAWETLASGWGNLATLARLNWATAPLPGLSGFVSCTVQFFFCWRIIVLVRNKILPLVIASIGLVQFGFATYTGVRAFILPLAEISTLDKYVSTWLGGSALADFLVTGTMVFVLFQSKSKTIFSQSKSTVDKLITLTVETGMTTAAGALAELILFVVFPNNNMHFLAFYMLAKLYSNTLLATLNARAFFTSRGAALWVDEMNTPKVSKTSVGSSERGIRITTEVQHQADNNGVELNIMNSTPNADQSLFMTKDDLSYNSREYD